MLKNSKISVLRSQIGTTFQVTGKKKTIAIVMVLNDLIIDLMIEQLTKV